ncbi:MAG: metalloregulator ArsR/SmtB family transcription factor [Lachnospiraceae bacterium]|nr:metalloregulator ArsR/SmtB family transcription factor [Lachnospiraceae bacterium]
MATKKSDCTPMFLESIEQVRKNMPKDQEVDQVVSFYKVLGDKTRLRILYALKEQEMCAGDIAVLLDMTKSAVSHQLAVMRNMHQIKSRREGKNVFYSLDDEHIVDILEEALVHMAHHQLEYPDA